MKLLRRAKIQVGRIIFACLFVMLGVGGTLSLTLNTENAYAEPVTTENIEETTESESGQVDEATQAEPTTVQKGASCKDSLGAIGWIVCPFTGKIAEAVDWLYDKIEQILIVNPVEMKDGAPIYEIWKYFRGVTNVVFIIFLLVMVYSQLTGLGINNYGLKKALPKLIVAAVLVNLSFIICSLAVDVSNIVGASLRGVFSAISEAAFNNMNVDGATYTVPMADIYAGLAAGTIVAAGGLMVAFETGAIWMLIPTILGAIVSVATGLITIAMRQAVVALLIMIAPLAIIASILPNTEKWYKSWKQLLMRMLVFYPMFSLLFGGSQLAGFAIITSARDGFGLVIGVAVQIFPLFFSWSLMKMSGTFLSTINARMNGIFARPLGVNRAWADSHRNLTRARTLASQNAYTPSLRLAQFLSNRRIYRMEKTKEAMELARGRGLAYTSLKHYSDYNKRLLNREGERAYENQARSMEYAQTVMRHKNNMEEGFGEAAEAAGSKRYSQISSLDWRNVNASDFLKAEQARSEMIEYRNAEGLQTRMNDAINSHMDYLYKYKRDAMTGEYLLDEHGERIRDNNYKLHFDNETIRQTAAARYNSVARIMNGRLEDVQYAAAAAAHSHDTQAKLVQGRFTEYFDDTVPTKDVTMRLEELTNVKKQSDNIDAIVAGLRILNKRGDTDLVRDYLNKTMEVRYDDMGNLTREGVQLGTHASQAIASFLMFDVKDNDPYLRRFGKYINLETAHVYNKNKRHRLNVDYAEYVKGYYEDSINPETHEVEIQYSNKDMVKLLEGTPLNGIERTALSSYDESIKEAFTDANGRVDMDAYLTKRTEIDNAMSPQFMSASLSFLSGSEQLVSAVKSKTGYYQKKTSDGGYVDRFVWEDNDEIDKYLTFRDGASEAEKEAAREPMREKLREWYQDQTLKYIGGQTPSQILGLRSDYYAALREHLGDALIETDDSKLTDEELNAKNEYLAQKAAIDEKYDTMTREAEERAAKEGKKPVLDDIDRARSSELSNAKDVLAGYQLRKMLDSKGTLEQIYRSRRSGAANAAKPWDRRWLGLDDESGIRMYEDRKRKEEKERRRAAGDDVDDEEMGDGTYSHIYTEDEVDEFEAEIRNLWDDYRIYDDSVFYDETLKYVEEKRIPKRLADEYKKWHEDHEYADSHRHMEQLIDILKNA